MKFRITLLQKLSDRTPWAVQARIHLAGGGTRTWPVSVVPDHGAAIVSVESGLDLMDGAARARTLVAHYADPPRREERQISAVARE